MKILILCIPPALGSAPLLRMLNNTWSVRLGSFANMIGMKLYLFVILLLGILLVAIKLGTLYMFMEHLYFLFFEVLEKAVCPFYYWVSRVNKKESTWYIFIIYIIYSDLSISQIHIKYPYAHTRGKCLDTHIHLWIVVQNIFPIWIDMVNTNFLLPPQLICIIIGINTLPQINMTLFNSPSRRTL